MDILGSGLYPFVQLDPFLLLLPLELPLLFSILRTMRKTSAECLSSQCAFRIAISPLLSIRELQQRT